MQMSSETAEGDYLSFSSMKSEAYFSFCSTTLKVEEGTDCCVQLF